MQNSGLNSAGNFQKILTRLRPTSRNDKNLASCTTYVSLKSAKKNTSTGSAKNTVNAKDTSDNESIATQLFTYN